MAAPPPVETKCSTSGSSHARPRATLAGRILVLSAAVVLALGWVVWVKERTRALLADLRQEYATIESERFLVGLKTREGVVAINGALLRFQLSGSAEEQSLYRRTAREMRERFASLGPNLHTPEEQRLVGEFSSAFDLYLQQTAEMAERPTRGIRRDTAEHLHELIAARAAPLTRLAEELVTAQQRAWSGFFVRSEQTLASLQRLLWTSVLALAALIAVLSLFIFRAFVAPLRVRLGESKERLERQEKLASLGVLAAGVAHEIRNPLTAIKMRLFSLKKGLPPEARDGEDLAVIHSEIHRLERIVKETLQFARPSQPRRLNTTPTELFEQVRNLLAGTLAGRKIELRVEPADNLPLAVDSQQIIQVLINLVQNGAESLNGPGTVTLRSRRMEAFLGGRSQPAIGLDVSDTGAGIPAEVEARMFDPFFSTKEGGTGLGLAIAARILDRHGGTIRYSTQLNRGTTFTLVLPIHAPDESPTAPD